MRSYWRGACIATTLPALDPGLGSHYIVECSISTELDHIVKQACSDSDRRIIIRPPIPNFTSIGTYRESAGHR